VIVVKLREAIRAYEERAGERLTYGELAKRTGLARATIETLGSRPSYNTTLRTIEKLCAVLECDLHDLLTFERTPRRRSR
jgi:putative transcriptional regulator